MKKLTARKKAVFLQQINAESLTNALYRPIRHFYFYGIIY